MILAFFLTAGEFFGPAIMLAGLAALLVCYRAGKSGTASRRTIWVALIPFGLGILGAIYGLALMKTTGKASEIQWSALVDVCVDGWVVTSIPLIWAASLLSKRPASA